MSESSVGCKLGQIAINRRDFGFCERSLLGSSLARGSFPFFVPMPISVTGQDGHTHAKYDAR